MPNVVEDLQKRAYDAGVEQALADAGLKTAGAVPDESPTHRKSIANAASRGMGFRSDDKALGQLSPADVKSRNSLFKKKAKSRIIKNDSTDGATDVYTRVKAKREKTLTPIEKVKARRDADAAHKADIEYEKNPNAENASQFTNIW